MNKEGLKVEILWCAVSFMAGFLYCAMMVRYRRRKRNGFVRRVPRESRRYM